MGLPSEVGKCYPYTNTCTKCGSHYLMEYEHTCWAPIIGTYQQMEICPDLCFGHGSCYGDRKAETHPNKKGVDMLLKILVALAEFNTVLAKAGSLELLQAFVAMQYKIIEAIRSESQ